MLYKMTYAGFGMMAASVVIALGLFLTQKDAVGNTPLTTSQTMPVGVPSHGFHVCGYLPIYHAGYGIEYYAFYERTCR